MSTQRTDEFLVLIDRCGKLRDRQLQDLGAITRPALGTGCQRMSLTSPPLILVVHLIGTNQQEIHIAVRPPVPSRERTERDEGMRAGHPVGHRIDEALFRAIGGLGDAPDGTGEDVLSVPPIRDRLSVLLRVDETVVDQSLEDGTDLRVRPAGQLGDTRTGERDVCAHENE